MSPAALAKWAVFAAGLAFLGWIAAHSDLGAVAADVARLGWGGAAAVVVAFFIGFSADVIAWLLTFALPASPRNAGRLWLVQMVGEAVNTLMPFGSLGGEPVKAMLLKRHYGVRYREATASLVLGQAINTLAEVPFIAVGLVLVLTRHVLPPLVETAMTIACACVALFTFVLFVALHLRLLATLERRLAAGRWGDRLQRGLAAVRDVEEQLFTFVRRRPARFCVSVGSAFVTWVFGAVEVLIVLRLLGAGVSWQEAWMVEAAVVLARNATFFVPGHMGSQDGALVLVIGAVTGTPDLGLAVALIRRGRELFTSSIGLAIGTWFGLKPSALVLDQQS